LRRIGDAAAAARLIAEHKLACDCVPARLLEAPEVWQALLADMSVPALLRSLGKMAALGLLRPSVAVARTVAERLLDARLIKRSRVHPVAIVHALAAVQEGGSVDSAIPDALQRAFLAALANVVPTGKRLRLVVDAAGLTDAGAPRLAAAALLTIAARVEKEATFFAFAETPARLPISARSSLAAVLDTLQTLQPRRLDCARPIHAAQAARDPVDAFVVISGDAPAYGDVHPARALESYRQAMGIATRFAAISLTAREFALADPADRGMLDVIGFDATVPGVVADFVAGRI
jgi:60 kDa SS-A/Ro ribonucleoprotein